MKIKLLRELAMLVMAGVLSIGAICGCRPTPPPAAPSTAPEPAPEPAATTPVSAPEAPSVVAKPLISPAASSAVAPSNAPETVLVQVNDKTITQADLDAEIGELTRMMRSQGRADEQLAMMLPVIKPQILDSLVVRSLLSGEFAKQKISAAEEEINREIEKIKEGMPKGRNLDELLKSRGVSDKAFREDIEEQVKFSKLLGIGEPTDDESKAFYEENKSRLYEMPETVRARHILIGATATNSPAEKAARKAKAETLRKQLADSKGAEFEQLARDNSDCPSKAVGGDLGEFRKGQMVKEFEEAAYSLKTNEISAVVETEFGYHVIQLLEHNNPRTVPFDEVKNQIAAQLKVRQLQQKARPFIEDLRGKAKITYQHGAEPVKPMMMPPSESDQRPPAAEDLTAEPAKSQPPKESAPPAPPAGKAAAPDTPQKQ